MEEEEFVICADKLEKLCKNESRIESLFGVSVEPHKEKDLTELRFHSSAGNKKWIKIVSPKGEKISLVKAKNYILALTMPEECTEKQYTTDKFKQLNCKRDNIERESCAYLSFNLEGNTVQFQGTKNDVEKAETLAEEVLHRTRNFDDYYHKPAIYAVSHDSCYDSDSSVHESRRNSHRSEHEDVLRTSSDTLASELTDTADLYTVKDIRTCVNLDVDEKVADNIPDFAAKLEFATKCGYTKKQLLLALRKLGAMASQNDILSELINIGSQDGSHEEEPECISLPEEDSVKIPFPTIIAKDDASNLRPIVIDGSNVAMSHGNKEVFSCKGIKIVVEWFKKRGHKSVTVFVPQWRKEASRPITPISGQDILTALEKEGVLAFTPSRRIGGKRVVCYDDRYVIKLAAETDAIVVSNDNYRDLLDEFKKVIEERLLMYTFVNDIFMPPDDPLGRHGPNLENFLRKQPTFPEPQSPPCPYGKKCTYGNKCKYFHPERGLKPQKSVVDTIQEQAKLQLQEEKEKNSKKQEAKGESGNKSPAVIKRQLSRTFSHVSTSDCSGEKTPAKIMLSPQTFPVGKNIKLLEKNDDRRISYDDILDAQRKSDSEISIKVHSVLGGHWAEGLHDNIRSTMSDPNPHNPNQLYSVGGGHLSVAKKLSDEGILNDDKEPKVRNNGVDKPKVTLRSRGMDMSADSVQMRNGHPILQRQLTLQGSEDPRVIQQQNLPNDSLDNILQQTGYYETDSFDQPRTTHSQEFVSEGRYASYPFSDPYRYGSDRNITSNAGRNKLNSYPMYPSAIRQPASEIQYRGNAARRDTSLKEQLFRQQMSQSPEDVQPTLNRQSSSSDTQLYQVADELNRFCLVERGIMPYPAGDQNSRGSRVSWPTVGSHQNIPQQARYQNVQGFNVYGGQLSPRSMVQSQENPQQQLYHHRYPLQPQYSSPPPSYHTMDAYPVAYQLPPKYEQHALPQRPVLSPVVMPQVMDEMRPFLPNNPRYNMYYHLCSLFPEEKVLKIMNRYPNETNPSKICSYIIGSSD